MEIGNRRVAVEYWPIDRLALDPTNPRIHSIAEVAEMAELIKRFGFTNPILVDGDGNFIAGERRWRAAKSLGLTEVPVIPVGWVSDAERRALRMADNRVAMNGTWDEQLLAREMAFLQKVGAVDLGVLGFGLKEVERLLKGAHGGAPGRTQPDDIPEPAEVAVSMAGDTWLLGGHHRLRCGSSTCPQDVAALLEGEKPHLMVTDPPYGVNYDPSWRAAAGVGSTGAATGKVLNDDQADWRDAWRLFPGHVAYVWHGGLHGAVVQQSLEACEFKVRGQIIWVKQRPVLSRGAYHWQHEPGFYAVKGDPAADEWTGERFEEDHEVATYAVLEGETAKWVGGRKQSTVWNIEHIKNDTGHGTQKPVECMRRPIVNNSRIGDVVYEPFSGSGTTVVAAHIAGRRCFAMELNPLYVDVAVRRWQEFTGRVAILESDGRTFAEIAERRPAELAERARLEATAEAA